MGVYINLEIMPQRISPKKWAEVYFESVKLLKAYPKGMMGYKEENLGFIKRISYSRILEHDIDKSEKRHWFVLGDFKSMKKAESFELYYDLRYYRKGSKSKRTPCDILIDTVDDRNGESVNVFNEKTQGEPYHIPLLAIASLIETRFAPYALAGGDIDISQAKRAVKWANKILENDINLPIRVQPDNLYQRIKKYFKGIESMDAFQNIYRGSSNEMYEILFKKFDRSIIVQWFIRKLKNYKSPDQLGVINLFSNWLNVTSDIGGLCEIACINKDGPQFDPVKFAYALCSTWICIDKKSYEFLKIFKKPEGTIDTVNGQLGKAFLDMSGYEGRNIKCYINEKDLINILKKYFPEYIDDIKVIIQSQLKKIKNKLLTDQRIFKKSLKAAENKNYEEFSKMADSGHKNEDAFLNYKSYEKLTNIKKDMLKVFAYKIREIKFEFQKKSPKIFKKSSKEKWKILILITKEQEIRLTEDAWKWIDKEMNTDMLDTLLTLVIMKNYEQTFWNMRLEICENKRLCKDISRLMSDASLENETAVEILKEMSSARF